MFSCIRRLAKVLSSAGIFRFCDVTAPALEKFVGDKKSSVTGRTLASRRRLLFEIAESGVSAAFSRTLDSVAWGIESRVRRTRRADGGYKPLAEDLAVPLLGDALHWAEDFGPRLAEFIVQLFKEKASSVSVTKTKRRQNDHHLLTRHLPDELRNALADALNIPRGTTAGKLLRLARKETIAACATLILFMVGIRIGELLSLRRACTCRLRHSDGRDYDYIQGILGKSGGLSFQWIATQPVIAIVALLEKFNSVIHAVNRDDRLFATFPGIGILPHKGLRFTRKQKHDVNDMLKDFAHASRRTVPVPKDVRIHSHLGRKTFARFVAIRDKRGLESLAIHYGQVKRATTDKYYAGTDFDLNDLLAEEDRKDLEAALVDILSSKRLGGRAGVEITKRLADMPRFRGTKLLMKAVDRLIASGIRIAPCNWGYCLYRKELSACQGDNDGPNEYLRSPDICADCMNFSVTQKHRPFWEYRFQRNEEFLQRADLPEMTRALSTTRRESARAILGQLKSEKSV